MPVIPKPTETYDKLKSLAEKGRGKAGEVYDYLFPNPEESPSSYEGPAGLYRKLGRMMVPDPRSDIELLLATLPLGPGSKLPVGDRIKRDAILAMGKRPKTRGTQEILESVINNNFRILDSTNSVSRHKLVPFYMNRLENLVGLGVENRDPLGTIQKYVSSYISSPLKEKRELELAAMINDLEFHNPVWVNYLAPQDKLPELIGWARERVNKYIREGYENQDVIDAISSLKINISTGGR